MDRVVRRVSSAGDIGFGNWSEEIRESIYHKIFPPINIRIFMDRRSLLSLIGATAGGGLAGCSLVNGGDDLPEFGGTSIRELERTCTDAVEDTATISFREAGKRVDVSGRYGVLNTSSELIVRPTRDNTDKQKVIFRIDQSAAENANTDGSDCSGRINYEARVSLSTPPSEVVVQHTKEEVDDHESRTWLETVATSSP